MTKEELKQRSFEFGIRCIRLSRVLSKSIEGRPIGNQLIRSGTSVGANYRAACKARSRAEFVAKMGIVEEETDETCYWLEVIISSGMMKAGRIQPLLDEGRELCRIFGTSRKTASNNVRRPVAK